MSTRVKRICPSCGSPYLTAQVLTEAEVNTNLEWEISYISPQELNDLMDHPGNAVHCPRCEWDGLIESLIVMSDDDPSVYEEKQVEPRIPSTLSDISLHLPPEQIRSFKCGDILPINGENYVVISVNHINCNVLEYSPDKRPSHVLNSKLELYTLTPLSQDMVPTGYYVTFTKNRLNHILNNGA